MVLNPLTNGVAPDLIGSACLAFLFAIHRYLCIKRPNTVPPKLTKHYIDLYVDNTLVLASSWYSIQKPSFLPSELNSLYHWIFKLQYLMLYTTVHTQSKLLKLQTSNFYFYCYSLRTHKQRIFLPYQILGLHPLAFKKNII